MGLDLGQGHSDRRTDFRARNGRAAAAATRLARGHCRVGAAHALPLDRRAVHGSDAVQDSQFERGGLGVIDHVVGVTKKIGFPRICPVCIAAQISKYRTVYSALDPGIQRE